MVCAGRRQPGNGSGTYAIEGQQITKDYLGRVTPEREWSGQFAAPSRGRDF